MGAAGDLVEAGSAERLFFGVSPAHNWLDLRLFRQTLSYQG